MKKILLFACIAVLGVAFSTNAQSRVTNPNSFRLAPGLTQDDYLPRTIILKVKPEYRQQCSRSAIAIENLDRALRKSGNFSVEKVFPNHQAPATERNAHGQRFADLSLIYKVTFDADLNIEKAINSILSSGMVVYAEPYYVYKPVYNPNDPNTGLQSYLTKIQAYQAWDIQKGDTNVVIGIVDTGTDWDHPDLSANLKYNYADPINGSDDDGDGYVDNYRGWDLADNDNNPMVDGTGNQAHGSHVSGCADAVTDNGVGVASPGFKCKFLPVKTSRASDPNAYLVQGYQGIVYAADHGCSVINCSWGGGGGGTFGQDAIDYATINMNALVVCAAGNDGNELAFYPASYKYVLSVASVTATDAKSGFSNYGANIDVCAPGSNIYNTYYNNTYAYLSGTSMASPIAAGAAAIVKSQFPSFTGMQVGEKVRMNCDDIYSVSGNGAYLNKLGRGRINMYKALTLSSPSVRFEDKVTTDNNDDTFVIGDTLSITGNFVNYLDPTTNLVATLTTTSSYVTILNGTYNIGALATLASVDNNSNPFLIKINPTAPQNAKITFKLTFTDGAYNDFQLIEEIVNVDYINITINDVFTTITSKGRLFWNGTGQSEGLGFFYSNEQLNYEGGLMIGNSNNVSDNVRASGATPDNDFQSSLVVQRVIPTVFSEFDLYGKFNDNPAAVPLKVSVTHRAFAWSTPGDRKFVIVEYNIKNTGTSALSSLYAGIFSDWDVMDYSLNKADQDVATKMGYIYSTQANGLFAGIKLLTQGPWLHYAIDNVTGGAGGVDITTNYTSALKYTTLSTNRPTAGGTGTGNDVCDVVSTGPFVVNANDSVVVAFALIAGDDLNDLINSANNAQIKYDGITSVHEVKPDVVASFSVFPNPASEDIKLDFNLSEDAPVILSLMNMAGQELHQLDMGALHAGKHSVVLKTSEFENGMYFIKVTAGQSVRVSKFAVLK